MLSLGLIIEGKLFSDVSLLCVCTEEVFYITDVYLGTPNIYFHCITFI